MTDALAKIQERRRNETSRIFTDLGARSALVNTAGNEAVQEILREQFTRLEQLNARRLAREQEIQQLNEEYAAVAQDVLSDDALAFLVANSQIDVPTLTSIFAGFELARASRADREAERVDRRIEEFRTRTEREQQLLDRQRDLDQREIALIEADRERAQDELELRARTDIAVSQAEGREAVQQLEGERISETARLDRESRERIASQRIDAQTREENRDQTILDIINEARKLGKIIIGLLADEAIASYKRLPLTLMNRKKSLLRY